MKKILTLTLPTLVVTTLSVALLAARSNASGLSIAGSKDSVAGDTLELAAQFDMIEARDMVVSDGYAYIGVTDLSGGEGVPPSRVAIIDINDPTHPVEVGAIPLDFWDITVPAVTVDTLYIGYEEVGFLIYDVSAPSNPIFLGSLYPSGIGLNYFTYQIITAGNLAYVADRMGLIVLDISNPAHPIVVGEVLGTSINTLAVQGNHAYATGGGALIIFNITDPENPLLVKEYYPDPSRAGPTALTINGSYAYISGNVNLGGPIAYYSEAIDISDPENPEKVSDLPQLAAPNNQLTIQDSTLYAARWDGLAMFDASDPLDPQPLGQYPGLRGFKVQPQGGQVAYLDQYSGFHLLDASDPADLERIGFYGWPNYTFEVTAAGTNLYTLGRNDFAFPATGARALLQVIDSSDPYAPIVMGNIVLEGYQHYVKATVAEPYVFVPTVTGLLIVDVTDPIRMDTAFIDLGGEAYLVKVVDDVAYTLVRSVGGYIPNWLSVIDISDPLAPHLLGEFGLGYETNDITIASQNDHTYAFIVDSGLLTLDVTDPAMPVEIYRAASGYDRIDSVSHGAQIILYISLFAGHLYPQGIVALDASNPAQPVQLGFFDAGVSWMPLVAEGDLVYFVGGSLLQLVDFGDPTRPLLVSGTAEPVYAFSLTADSVYTIMENGSVAIYNKNGDTTGRVTDHNWQPIPGVDVALSTGLETITGADGTYFFSDLDFGTYTVTPTLEGFTFIPPTHMIEIPAGEGYASFTMLAAPISATLEPGITTTLTYTDTQGLPTNFIFPSGLVSTTATVTVTPTLASPFFGMDFAGHAFDLSVRETGSTTEILTFTLPISVTIHYSTMDTAVITDTAGLALYHREGDAWMMIETGCLGEPIPVPVEPGVFRAALCQAGRYALFGPTHAVAMPFVSFESDAGGSPPLPPVNEGLLTGSEVVHWSEKPF
jgi:hypothetical protein